jgi:hypothetical protein
MTLLCKHCGRDFQRHSHMGALPKYCNDLCGERAKRARMRPIRKQRYRELRLLGASVDEAHRGHNSPRAFAALKLELESRRASP